MVTISTAGNSDMMTIEKYKMSFTSTGLLRKETIQVAGLHLASHTWEQIQQQVLEGNCLQLKAMSSRKRVFAEIKSRLECLTEKEIQILCAGYREDVDVILWLALCRRYRFIGDFAREVLHEKYLSRELQMKSADYNIFWESKSIQHPELSTLTTATCARLRQMLFHFMRGCDLLDEKNMIQPLNLSAGNQDLFTRENLNETAFFPLDSRRVTI